MDKLNWWWGMILKLLIVVLDSPEKLICVLELSHPNAQNQHKLKNKMVKLLNDADGWWIEVELHSRYHLNRPTNLFS